MRIDPPLKEAARYPITSLIALASIAASTVWWAGNDIEPVLPGPVTALHRPWGLILGVFPHVNVVHLAFNLLWAWTLGTRVERIFGRARYVVLLLVLAVVSSAADYTFSVGGVGLSGVVYGLFGLTYAMRTREPLFAQVANRQTVQLFVAWFFICIVLTVTNTMPIGNVAHGSGAVMGWLIGRACASPSPRRTRWLALAAACSVVSLIGATVARPFVSGALDGQLHARAGYEAMERGDYAAAVKELEQAAGSPSVRAGTLINLGIAYQRLHRDSEALALYRRAIAMDPTRRPSLVEAMVSILHAQGHEDAKDGRFDDAVRALKEAAELEPRDVYAWRMLGYVHETQGDLDTAHAYYIRASQLSPDDEELAASVKHTAPERGDP